MIQSQLAHKRTKRLTVHVHVRIDKDAVDWLDKRVEELTFKDRSHAVNVAVRHLIDSSYKVESLVPIFPEEQEAEGRKQRGHRL